MNKRHWNISSHCIQSYFPQLGFFARAGDLNPCWSDTIVIEPRTFKPGDFHRGVFSTHLPIYHKTSDFYKKIARMRRNDLHVPAIWHSMHGRELFWALLLGDCTCSSIPYLISSVRAPVLANRDTKLCMELWWESMGSEMESRESKADLVI